MIFFWGGGSVYDNSRLFHDNSRPFHDNSRSFHGLSMVCPRSCFSHKKKDNKNTYGFLLLILESDFPGIPRGVKAEHGGSSIACQSISVPITVHKVPVVLELEIVGISRRREPWKPGVGLPSRASGHLVEEHTELLVLLVQLIEDGVDSVIRRPGRGRKTGCLQIHWPCRQTRSDASGSRP